jgi:O-antigen biosynthesis protein
MLSTDAIALALWQPKQDSRRVAVYENWPELVRTEIQDTPEDALALAAKKFSGRDVLLLQVNRFLPAGFLPRMLAAWRQHERVDVLSPLTKDNGLVVPAMTASEIDSAYFLYGEHSIKPINHWSQHGSLWRASAVHEVFENKQRNINQLNLALLNGVYLGNDNDAVESNFEKILIGDGKPVVLHVLHSWGGGVEYFARDLSAGDNDRHHLFLKANSLDNHTPFGKQLALYQPSVKTPLQSWYLASPIDDTGIQSEEVQQILKDIIDRWGIGAVIVSSLIGHSLDVLKTGLPTIFSCHDVYPFWPLLQDRREADKADFSMECLQSLLNEDSDNAAFKKHSAEYWVAIKDHLIETIISHNIRCVAPTHYAKKRLCAIDSRLNNIDWQVIPHGSITLTRIPRVDHTAEPKKNKILRVLVPGHLNDDKGETLLLELLPALPPRIELVLLGCADYLEHKFQHPAVTCYPAYQREDLSKWVEKIKPDIALLPSLVPETFGYILSEMLAVGPPVLCANIGAYGERAQSLNSIVTVDANAKAFIEKLLYFRDFPAALDGLVSSTPHSLPSITNMAQAWAEVSRAQAPNWLIGNPSSLQAKEKSVTAQIIELQKLLAEHLERSLHSESEFNEKLLQQQNKHDEAMLELNRLNAAAMEKIRENIALLEKEIQALNQQLQAVYASSSWRLTAILRNIKTWFSR